MNKSYVLFAQTGVGKRLCKIYTLALLLVFISGNAVQAQLSLTNAGNSALINFSSTIAGVENGTFLGTGFTNTPAVGQLDSDGWSVNGWSFGNLAFGGSLTSDDYARGATAVAITTGGIYAQNASGNTVLMFQPGGSDFTPGYITLKIVNNGTSIINQLALSYNIFVRNDNTRSNSFNFSYSNDDVTYTPFAAFDYATPGATDPFGWVVGATKSGNLTGISIPATGTFYLRWSSDDLGVTGARDEIGLDDISITATYPGPCTPPSTNATLNSINNVLSTQMDVNFTRGNGTGGLLIVASPAALSQNPISGFTYTANSNYGTGSALGNGFVVYASGAVLPAPGGTGTVTITGLTPSTTYNINLFEYDVTVPCYTATGVLGTQATSGSSVTAPGDLFRSRVSGNWANASTWESFSGGSWVTATLAPTSASAGITILLGHTININSSVSMDQTTVFGALTVSTSGILNLADGAGTDLNVQGTLKFQTTANYTTAFVRGGGTATLNVGTSGMITIGNGASTPGYSPLGYLSGLVAWNNGSVFEWNTTDPFVTASATPPLKYFPDAVAGVTPIFRVSKSPSLVPGASTATEWNGLMEVNANLTLRLGGTKTFRDGIIGTANLTQDDDCGQFIITGSTAVLGGAGSINLNNLSTFGGGSIGATAVVTMTSNKIVNQVNSASLTLTSGGALYCDLFSLTGTTTFSMLGTSTLRLGSPLGITAAGATGNVQTTARTFSNTGNYIYNGIANQVTGDGLPTAMSSLTINNTGGVGNKTTTLTTANTTTPVLTLTAGLFAAGSGQKLNISAAGTVAATAGDFATGATAGILNFVGAGLFTGNSNPYDVYAQGNVNFGVGTVTIQSGGSFRINTGVVTNGTGITVGPFYGTNSTLVYNTGAAFAPSNEWTSGTWPARGAPFHVNILASGTAVTFNSASVHNTAGDLNISTGTSFTLNAAGGDLSVGGNWTRAATGAFTHNNRKVTFNGTSSTQIITVTGGGQEVFGYLAVNKPVGFPNLQLAGSPNATNIAINGGNAGGFALALTYGNLDLNQNTVSFKSWNGGQNNIQIDQVASPAGDSIRNVISTGGQGFFNIDNNDAASHFVTISRANPATNRRASLTFSSNVKITLMNTGGNAGGIDFGITPISTINGILQLNTGGFVINNSPIYGNGSTLIYNTGGTFNRNLEWGATVNPGYPYNVTVQGNTLLQLNTPNGNGDADRALAGSLTVASGSTLLLSTTAPNKLTIGQDLVLNGTLTLPTVVGGDLYVGRDWTRTATGVFNDNTRAVFFNSSGNSTITATNGQYFSYLFLAKSVKTDKLLLNDSIMIKNLLNLGTGTLDLQDKNVHMKSNATATASIDKINATNAAISYSSTGRFVVERYVPTALSVSSPFHKKSWLHLAVPVFDNGQTIKQAWQEGAATVNGDPKPGFGTQLTSDVANAASQPSPGFDVATPAGPSMKTYVPAGSTWLGVSSTQIPIANAKGYMVFVRGDRSVTTYNPVSVPPTTLRVTGKLYDPSNTNPSTVSIGSNLFESIGNPYASAIDISSTTGVVRSNISDVFYVWDPRLAGGLGYGRYETFISSSGPGGPYTIVNGGGSYGAMGATNNLIQSGQAFFMFAGAGGGTVTINENAKTGGSSLVTRVMNPATIVKQLRTSLYIIGGGNRVHADAALSQFDNAYSKHVDIRDALKLPNTTENLSIKTNDSLLCVERTAEIRNNDTIHYNLSQLNVQQYQFEWIPQNVARQGLKAYLVDKYLNTQTQVSLTDTTRINFSVLNIPGSYAADRFMLVFVDKSKHVPLATTLNCQKSDAKVLVNWEAMGEFAGGAFEVERSADGVNFSTIHTELLHSGDTYSWIDANPLPGTNFYRIHNPDPLSKTSYSNLVKIVSLTGDKGITVSPNPVTGNLMKVRFNSMEGGDYLLKLFTQSGQLLFTKNLVHAAGSGSESVKLRSGISKGVYKLEITSPDGSRIAEQVLVQ